jgi:hypothetical protein
MQESHELARILKDVGVDAFEDTDVFWRLRDVVKDDVTNTLRDTVTCVCG